MKRILQLDKENYDLWITYTWSPNNHGVCGHTFEVVDYYTILSKHFRVGILLAEDMNIDDFIFSIKSKYDFTQKELSSIIENTVYHKRPGLVQVNNILFTDGGARSLKDITLYADKIFHFACGDFELSENKDENQFILQDERVYGSCFNSINYKKKILFSRYKKIKNEGKEPHSFLLYGTKNCRNIAKHMYDDLLEKYDGNFLCITSKENRVQGLDTRFKFVDMPVSDLFEKFDTYIYTPVPRKFDCSPRFIAECRFYNKKVEFFNIDYWDEDKGLFYRNWDIENDFDSLFLKEDDAIINILKELI